MMPMKPRFSFRLLFLGSILAAATGCADEGRELTADEGYAESPERAVTLYRAAYLQRDPFALDKILADDYRHRLTEIDADSLQVEREWDRDAEIEIAMRMLGGELGVRADSLIQCPLDVLFNLSLGPLGDDWQPVEEGALAGTLRRDFSALGNVSGGEFGIDFISGRSTVYVRRDPIDAQDRCCAFAYRIVYWDDRGLLAGKHGSFPWARIRARWRPDAPDPTNECPLIR